MGLNRLVLSTRTENLNLNWVRGSRVAETIIVSHNHPGSAATRAAEVAIGKPPSPWTRGYTRGRSQQSCSRHRPGETVKETVGREPLRERTLRLNLFGSTLFEFEWAAASLRRTRPAWRACLTLGGGKPTRHKASAASLPYHFEFKFDYYYYMCARDDNIP